MANGATGATGTIGAGSSSTMVDGPEARIIDSQVAIARRQVKLIDFATRVLIGVVALVGFLLFVVMVDHWVFDLGIVGRWLVLLILLGASVWYCVKHMAWVFWRAINPLYAARMIEQNTPSLKNDLVNYLLLRKQRASMHEGVFRAIQGRTASEVESLEIEAAIDHSPVFRLGYVLVGIVALAGLYKIVSPKDPVPTIRRVLTPWAAISRPARVRILEINPGDSRAFLGENVPVVAKLAGVTSTDPVSLVYATEDGQVVDRRVVMEAGGDGRAWQATLPPDSQGLQQSLFYRVEAGDATSVTYRLEARPAPLISVRKVTYDYPAYTQRERRVVERQGDLSAVEGTRVAIEAHANQPIKSAWIEFAPPGDDGADSAVAMLTDGSRIVPADRVLHLNVDGQTARQTIVMQMGAGGKPKFAAYTVRFLNADDRRSERPVIHRIDVTPDFPPEVEIVAPTEDRVTLAADAELPIETRAVDPDFGLRRLVLEGRMDGAVAFERELFSDPVGQPGQVLGGWRLSPQELGLKPGDKLVLQARAEDNRTGESRSDGSTSAPQSANVRRSRELTVEIGMARRADPLNADPNAQRQTDEKTKSPTEKPSTSKESQAAKPKTSPSDSTANTNSPPDGKPSSNSSTDEMGKRSPRNEKKTQGNPADGENQGEGKQGKEKPEDRKPAAEESGEEKPSGEKKGQTKSGKKNSGDDQQNGEKSTGKKPDQQPSSKDSKEKDQADGEKPGKDEDGKEKAGKDQPGKDQPGKDQKGKDQSGKDQAGKDQTGKDQAGKDQTLKQQPNDPKQGKEQSGDQKQQGPKSDGGAAGSEASGKEKPNDMPGGGAEGSSSPPSGSTARPERSNTQGGGGSNSQNSQPDGAAVGSPSPGNSSAEPPGTPETSSEEGTDGASKDKQGALGQGTPTQPLDDGDVFEKALEHLRDKQLKSAGAAGKTPGRTGAAGKEPGVSQEAAKPPMTPDATTEKPSPQDPEVGQEGVGSRNDSGANQGKGGSPQGKPETKPDKPRAQPGEAKPSIAGEGSNGQSGAGEAPKEANGSPKAVKKNEDSNKTQQPDNSKPADNSMPPTASESEKQSDSKNGVDGDKSGGGRQGGGQGANQKGNDSAGANSAADEGAGAASEAGAGDVSDKGGDKMRSPNPTGKPGTEKGVGTTTKPDAAGNKVPNQPDGPPGQGGTPPRSPEAPKDAAPPSGNGGGGRATAGGGVASENTGPRTAQPTGPVAEGESANMNYARQATDLVLNHLRDQADKPDPELLRRLGWTQEDLRQFVDRWQTMKDAARDNDPEARRELNDALRSLGLRPTEDRRRAAAAASDAQRGNRDAGARSSPPAKYRDRFEAYRRGTSR